MEIKRLPNEIISKIAAGEVIISPSAIIKELLENSLDAGASKIEISLNSELKKIAIKDNGKGINKDDFEFLCLNHYTSKMDALEDLKQKGTVNPQNSYGFRGEALHSISQCSRIEISSTKEGSYKGKFHGENLIELKKTALNEKGTLIEIDDIFYNNEIRALHFNKNKKELIKCIELVKSYGIIQKGIQIKIDGKYLIDERSIGTKELNAPGFIDDRIRFIKTNITGNTDILSKASQDFVILMTKKCFFMKSFTLILFINKRLINCSYLKTRIMHKLKNGEKPFLFIEMKVTRVDVNVHPGKMEVMVEDNGVYDAIMKEIDCIFDECNLNEKTDNKSTQNGPANSSPFKIYSSPFKRSLDQFRNGNSKKTEPTKLSSIKSLISKEEVVDANFLKNIIFVGNSHGFIFMQHKMNLLKAQARTFLREVIYMKILKDLGNLECKEVVNPSPVEVQDDLHPVLKEYFGIHIQDSMLIGIPIIYGNSFIFNKLESTKKNEKETLEGISRELAEIYSGEMEINEKIFNEIKAEALCTEGVLGTFSILTDLTEIYKGFERC